MIEANFEKLTLIVPVQNKKVLLRAEPELIKASISLKMIKGTILEFDQGFMMELKRVEGEKRVEAVSDLVVHLLTLGTSRATTTLGKRSRYHYPGGNKDSQLKVLQIPTLLKG